MLKRINFIAAVIVLLTLIMSAVWTWYPGFASSAGEHPDLGLWGAIFLLFSLLYSLLKRATFFPSVKGFWADIHALFGLIGVVFILVHSAGNFFSFYGLLTLSMCIIFLLGLNLRIPASYYSRRRFGSKIKMFLTPSERDEKVEALIKAKESLLRFMKPEAKEGTYGLRFTDWISSPMGAMGYLGLSFQERQLVRQKVGVDPWYFYFSHRYGRVIHIIMAVVVIAWFFIHAFDSCHYFRF